MIDVRVAATAIQRDDLFPDVSEQQRSICSTIVLELGTNIVKYAGSGKILLRGLRLDGRQAIEVIAIDQGPGIADVKQAMQDHFTTGKTLGLGLGSVRRLADDFELVCPPEGGTRVRTLSWADASALPQGKAPRRPAPAKMRSHSPQPATPVRSAVDLLQISNVERTRPALSQQASGDRLLVLDHGHLAFRIVLDGTGHGAEAHRIVSDAAAAIEQDLAQQIADVPWSSDGELSISAAGIAALMTSAISAAHARIRGSRGAAMGMAVIDRRNGCLHFVGIGNTRILLLAYRGWEGVSRDGQLGVNFRRPVVQTYPLSSGDVVLQASDGIRTATLRAMRPRRSGVSVDPEQVASALLQQATFADDVSILLSRCHA